MNFVLTDKHYLNDPLPADSPLNKEEMKRILGGEATMWAELVTNETVDSPTGDGLGHSHIRMVRQIAEGVPSRVDRRPAHPGTSAEEIRR